MSIAQSIKKYRADHNLTQKQFSELVGVTQAHISMYESSKLAPAPIARANMIALGFPEDEFAMEKGENLYMANVLKILSCGLTKRYICVGIRKNGSQLQELPPSPMLCRVFTQIIFFLS